VELGQVQKNFQSGELAQLRDQITKLQSQLVQQKSSAGGASDELNSLRSRASELERETELKEKKLKLLMTKNDELNNEFAKREEDVNKRLEKARADIKSRDDQIKELEDLVKRSKKEALGSVKDTAELDNTLKEVSNLRKQLQEVNKVLKQTETKVQTAESRAKKAEGRATKAEEDLVRVRENASKPQSNITRPTTNTLLASRADGNKINNTKRVVNPKGSPRNSPRDDVFVSEDSAPQLENSVDGPEELGSPDMMSSRLIPHRKTSRGGNSTFLRKGQGQSQAQGTRTTSISPSDFPMEDEV
jgi:myosin heavy subunit